MDRTLKTGDHPSLFLGEVASSGPGWTNSRKPDRILRSCASQQTDGSTSRRLQASNNSGLARDRARRREHTQVQ